jgi:hypothetical protein
MTPWVSAWFVMAVIMLAVLIIFGVPWWAIGLALYAWFGGVVSDRALKAYREERNG